MKDELKLSCLWCNLTIRPNTDRIAIVGQTREQRLGQLFDQAMRHLQMRHMDKFQELAGMLAQFSSFELLCHFEAKDEQLVKDRQVAAAVVHRRCARVLLDSDIHKTVEGMIEREYPNGLEHPEEEGLLPPMRVRQLLGQMRDWLNYLDVLPLKPAVSIDGSANGGTPA